MNQESGSEEEEDEESATEAPTLRPATVAIAPPVPSQPSPNQAESSGEETTTAVAESKPPATAHTQSLTGNIIYHDDPESLDEPNRPSGGSPPGYPPAPIDLLANAIDTLTTQHLLPLAGIPNVARIAAPPSPPHEDATENHAPEAYQEGLPSSAESSVQPIFAEGQQTSGVQILSDPEVPFPSASLQNESSAQPKFAKGQPTSIEQILSDPEVPFPSASIQNDPPAASIQTTLVEGAPSLIDEAIPVSTAVFPTKDNINTAAPPADLPIQGHKSEPPVI